MGTLQANRLMRLPEVSELTSLGKSTINLWVAQGRFPPPIALSATIKVWRQSDLDLWISKAFGDTPEATCDVQAPNVHSLHRQDAK